MKRRRLLKRLNTATVELSEPGVWLIDEKFATELREAMVAAWQERDGDPKTLAARIGASDWSNAEELVQIVDGIAVVNVSGMLFPRPNMWTWYGLGTAASDIRDATIEALQSKEVRGVLMLVDSPGGRAQGVFEAVRRIRSEAAIAGKPIWSYVDGVAASGGYAFAAAGSRVMGGAMSLSGSIGALMIHTQFRPEDQTFNIVRYGENKALGTPFEPFSDKARADWQKIVDGVGIEFEVVVAEARGVSVQQVQARFGRGSTFYGGEAVDRGLLDAVVESPEAAIEQLRKSVGLSTAQTGGGVRAANHESGRVATQSATVIEEGSSMNPRVKAALFARQLIAALDVADDVCTAVMAAFFKARDQAVPADDEAKINGIMGNLSIATVATPLVTQSPAATSAPAASAAGVANNVQTAHDREQAEARAAVAADERARINELQTRGRALGIDDARIQAAIQSGQPIGEALVAWTATQVQQNPPVNVQVLGERGAQQFERDAVDALALRFGLRAESATPQARQWGRAGRGLPLYLARQSLALRNVRVHELADGETVAQSAMRAGVQSFEEVLMDDSAALNRPASFPNILSGLANRIVAEGMERSNPTYQEWTGVLPGGLPDLKPVPVINKSTVYVMDEQIDDEKVNQLTIREEVKSSIQVRRFKNKFGWTPVMVANDDMNAFVENMLGFGRAAEQTVNLLCLNILTMNVTLLDGTALFASGRGNLKSSSAGAPDATQWEAMDLLMAAQSPVGGEGYVREQLQILLAPPQLRVKSLQLLAPFGQVPEVKNPVTDATLNVYRGTGKVVIEPELQAASSAIWYGLTDPQRMPLVVRVYQTGWGEGPKRTSWVDPETGTAWVAYEVRVGAAVKDYRAGVRNNGA